MLSGGSTAIIVTHFIARMTTLKHFLLHNGRTAWRINLDLLRILIPVILLVRCLDLVGLVEVLGQIMTPVMDLVGLPGELGLVWATTMLTNLYGGMAVLVNLDLAQPLSVAQVTVLTGMMLIAHALPVEARIAQAAGIRIWFTLSLRIGIALIYGMLFQNIYEWSGTLQQPVEFLWTSELVEPGWGSWLLAQANNLTAMIIIVFALVYALAILKKVGVIDWISRLLRPLLRTLGVSQEATSLTLIGLTLGISYGGGLVIEEARSGRLSQRDVLYTLSLLGLSHSIIEDTILMMLVGGHLSGILFGRLLLTFFVLILLVRLVQCMSEPQFKRFLAHPVRA